jgi:hypothetical protein
VLIAGGNYAAVSVDGCAVRLTGDERRRRRHPTGYGSRTFVPRATLTLCGPRATTTMADVVNPAPRGARPFVGRPTVNEGRRRERSLRRTAASDGRRRERPEAERGVPCPLEPVRLALVDVSGTVGGGGARIHVKVVPERKLDGTRLWTADCGVIPQVDRIGGAISQISVFFNVDPRGHLIGATARPPKLTGRVAGYPEYEHWVLITKDGRLPWIPVTLADKLDIEGESAIAPSPSGSVTCQQEGAGRAAMLKTLRDAQEQ